MVVNFDHVDKRPEVRLPKGHRSGAEVLTDGAPETLDQRRIDPDVRNRILLADLDLLPHEVLGCAFLVDYRRHSHDAFLLLLGAFLLRGSQLSRANG
jgi:hypothetical protein